MSKHLRFTEEELTELQRRRIVYGGGAGGGRTALLKDRMAAAKPEAYLISIDEAVRLHFEPLLVLNLPMPPSVDNYFRPVPTKTGKARFVLGKEGRAYRRTINALVTCAMVHLFGRFEPPLGGRLELRVIVHFPTAAGDINNRSKALEDALQFAGVYTNDSQLDKVIYERGEKRKPGCVEVSIYAYHA